MVSAGAAITGGRVTVDGCGSESVQGDVRFAEVMGLMGAQVDWNPTSITVTGAPLCLHIQSLLGMNGDSEGSE